MTKYLVQAHHISQERSTGHVLSKSRDHCTSDPFQGHRGQTLVRTN